MLLSFPWLSFSPPLLGFPPAGNGFGVKQGKGSLNSLDGLSSSTKDAMDVPGVYRCP